MRVAQIQDVPGKPYVTVVEDVLHHPRHSQVGLEGINYIKWFTSQDTPWHVWLTDSRHAIYDYYAVTLVDPQGCEVVPWSELAPPRADYREKTDLIQRQREYLSLFFAANPLKSVETSPKPVEIEIAEIEPKVPHPQPQNITLGDSGWLDPKGRFYPVCYGVHDEWEARAHTYGWHPPVKLRSLGWIAISNKLLKGDGFGSISPTQDQLDALFDAGIRVVAGYSGRLDTLEAAHDVTR